MAANRQKQETRQLVAPAEKKRMSNIYFYIISLGCTEWPYYEH